MNKILALHREDFTVTVQAGLPLAALQAALAEAQQWLTVDWPWGSDPNGEDSGSVGGLVARGLAGGLAQRHLGVRDQLIGISLIRADGTISKAGGQVVKNVAGYDLMRLLCGSWGSLGLITELTVRTMPQPKHRGGLLMHAPLEKLAVLRKLCLQGGLTPQRLDLWHEVLSGKSNHALLLGIASMSRAAMSEQLAKLGAEAEKHAIQVQKLDADNLLDMERLGWGAKVTSGARAAKPDWLLRLGVIPAHTINLMSRDFPANLKCSIATGLGMGIAWSENGEVSSNQVARLRRRCQILGGDLLILRQPPGQEPLPYWQDSPSKKIIEAVKRSFDPLQQLARGRLPGVEYRGI
jgi:glycolate oxidase FAD binding subunit